MSNINNLLIKNPPFESQIDTALFYESASHLEGLARLSYLVADQGMGMGALTGEIGAGKTMLLSVLQDRLDPEDFICVYLNTTYTNFEHILGEILFQLLEKINASIKEVPEDIFEKYKLFETVTYEFLSPQNKHLIILLDETHTLEHDCLQRIKFLTNYNQTIDMKLSVILAGQTELRTKLRKFPEIYQRLGMFYHLNYLENNEVEAYIQHRLANSEHPVSFSEDGIKEIIAYSKGCPRQINRVCKLAFHKTIGESKNIVPTETVQSIIEDIKLHFG
mgnify:FL=1